MVLSPTCRTHFALGAVVQYRPVVLGIPAGITGMKVIRLPRLIFRKRPSYQGLLRANTPGHIWIRLDGTPEAVETGLPIRYGDWDSRNQRVRGRTTPVRALNMWLQDLILRAVSTWYDRRRGVES